MAMNKIFGRALSAALTKKVVIKKSAAEMENTMRFMIGFC
jgi:hypothetical protein